MIQREVIVNKLVEFYTGKVDELANQNALIMIFRPFCESIFLTKCRKYH